MSCSASSLEGLGQIAGGENQDWCILLFFMEIFDVIELLIV